MKKLNLWEKEEIKLLEDLFNNTPLQNPKSGISKTKLIQIGLKNKGFKERTLSSIRKKCFRLGFTDYKVENEDKITTKCNDCSKPLTIRIRYYNNYDKSNLRCDECREIKRKSWSMTEKGKEYHKKYQELWRKI